VSVLYSCLFFVRLKIQMRKENQNGSNGSMITWDDFGCRSDVVSDVVQIAGGIQKFDILLCDRSKHSERKDWRGPHAINIAAE
jgi:hypothetical protein